MDRVRILVVEDEPKVAQALRTGLEAEEYVIALAHTGEDGFFLANSQPFDLVVLDVMLPKRTGVEVVSAMRKTGNRTPVLLLTARDTIDDKVRGLDAGADDYLVKPFAFPELLARVRALLRRGKAEAPAELRLQDLRLNRIRRMVARNDRDLDLTAKEFELLEYLLEHQGEVVSRDTLAREIWKEVARHGTLDNVIDVHIARLRRKVDEGCPIKLMHTVRGVGFVLKADKT